MKLHWSPRSPFVRKVMIVAHELGVAGQLELVRSRAAMNEVNAQLSQDNPLNKLPTLVLDNGQALYDSPVICEYLDGNGSLHPAQPVARIDALRRQALGDGLLDLLVIFRNERIRPPEMQSLSHLTAWRAKIGQTLDRMETEAPWVGPRGKLAVDIGDIAIGCALGYLHFRFSDLDWRAGRPILAKWAQRFEARPSARAAQAVGD